MCRDDVDELVDFRILLVQTIVDSHRSTLYDTVDTVAESD